MTLDLDRILADTPAAARQTFLLSAGSSLMPAPVVTAMQDYLQLEAEKGGYGAADAQKARLDGVYSSIARLINAAPEEIALVENATIGWQMAFYAIDFRPGDRILTAEAEYAANYVAYLQVAKRHGVRIDVVPSGPDGTLDVAALEAMIDDRVKLISVTWVPTNGGLVNPAAAIGRVARTHGILYLLDACQAVGQMPVDVEAIGCDMLAATGRKFLRGPRGSGFLYVRKDHIATLEPPMIDHFAAPWVSMDRYELRPDARRFENWENNYGARLGLGIAADYALAIGLEAIEARCSRLSRRMRDGLAEIAGFRIFDLGAAPSSIVSFGCDYCSAHEVQDFCAGRSVVIGQSFPSRTRIDSERRGLPDLLRASPHYFNTDADVDVFLETCAAISAHYAR